MNWGKARKKPVEIEFREVDPSKYILGHQAETIETREGMLFAKPREDFIIKGIEGEIYPIKKDIFYKTYDIIEPITVSNKQREK